MLTEWGTIDANPDAKKNKDRSATAHDLQPLIAELPNIPRINDSPALTLNVPNGAIEAPSSQSQDSEESQSNEESEKGIDGID